MLYNIFMKLCDGDGILEFLCPDALISLINCKYTNYSSKNKLLSLNFSLKVLYYLVFNNLYAENVSFFGIYFVFSQNKSVKLFIAPIYNKV